MSQFTYRGHHRYGIVEAVSLRDRAPATPGFPTDPASRRSRLPVLTASLLTCLVAVALVAVLVETALLTNEGQDLDQSAMEAVYARQGTLDQLLSLLGTISTGTAALALAVCVTLAVMRRRFAGAIAAVVLVAGANVTTQLLKNDVLQRPDLGHGVLNSLPSGHTTVVASVALAALLVAGRGMRTFVAGLGGFAVTLTGASTIVAGWHRPSDVLSGLAICLAWGAAAVFVLALRRPSGLHGRHGAPTLVSLLGAAAAGLVLVVTGVRPDEGWPGFTDAAVVLGLVGLASAAAVSIFERLSAAHAR